jgi:hypothetical protein
METPVNLDELSTLGETLGEHANAAEVANEPTHPSQRAVGKPESARSPHGCRRRPSRSARWRLTKLRPQ